MKHRNRLPTVFRTARRSFGCTLLALASLTAAPAHAQSYPSKPIRLVVPYPAGGMSESIARVVMPRLGELLGQQILVDLKLLAYAPFVLAGSPQLAAKSLAELIAHARAHPGKLNFAFGGQGSSPHLTGVALAAELGIEWTNIPMKGGGEALIAVAGNHADFLIAAVSSTLPHIKSGRLKALAVASESRLPLIPDVPTVAEAARLPGFIGATWQGVLAPPGTPPAVVEKLNQAIRRVAALPEVVEQLNGIGAIVAVGTPEQLNSWMQTHKARWEKLGRAKGITLE